MGVNPLEYLNKKVPVFNRLSDGHYLTYNHHSFAMIKHICKADKDR